MLVRESHDMGGPEMAPPIRPALGPPRGTRGGPRCRTTVYDFAPGGGGGGVPGGGGGVFGGVVVEGRPGVAGAAGAGGAEPVGGVSIGGGGGGGVLTRLGEYGREPRDTGSWLPLAYMHCM